MTAELSGLGAEPTEEGVRFRVWAPGAARVQLVVEAPFEAELTLTREPAGYFNATVPGVMPGAHYRFRLDGKGPYPDPRSRFQPHGPHGPSLVVDPSAYVWHDAGWTGIEMKGQVIYEMHIGAFTPDGTFDAAARQLAELKSLGVTVLEVLPIAEFPGRFNWGYDGVDLYAPSRNYGDHEAFKRFVDAAHGHGLGVILDVVYNHVGPKGNFLACFSPDYFTDRYRNDWGPAINFDGPDAGPVRRFFIDNARYWVREFHLDGLRLDATQSIHDASRLHILAEVCREARAAAQPRNIILVAENEPQRAEHLLPLEENGLGLDAMWNDDFHHSARVALTGRREGYFHDHRGCAQEFVSAAKRGFLFQGQYYHWQEQPRGSPVTTQPAWAFVIFTQNHDQVANTFCGERLPQITSPGRNRAITALLLLAPQTPMLYMGQEFAASAPFPFFADLGSDLAPQVCAGRREFMQQFAACATSAAQQRLPDPTSVATFESAKLDFSEREKHAEAYALHKDLLALRRTDPVIAAQARDALDGAVLTQRAFVLRWFDAERGDRLLAVNLGDEARLCPAPEPLLAPPPGAAWAMVWSSDDPRYGGPGAVDPCSERGWRLPGESAALLRAEWPPRAKR